jgi:two-component system, NtrC family, sensor kinase
MSLHLPMTLRRKFLLHNLLLVGALLLAGAVSVWRLGVVRAEVDLSRNVYAELRTVGNVGVDVGIIRGLLASPEANRDQLVTYLGYAIGGLEQFITVGRGYGPDGDATMRDAYEPMNHTAAAARQRLAGLLDRYKAGGPITAANAAADRKTVDAAMEDLDHVATSCLNFVSSRQQTASSHLASNVILIAGLSLAAVLAAIGLSVYHDRLVMAPLQRLRQGVRRVAEAQFTEKLDPKQMTSSPEFVELAEDFNRMGSELDGFYQKLEEQVRTKSRELVRSERLASVGFLAAGVAHEINNPLNIISGYAELTDKQLEPGRGRLSLEGEDALRARECLKIIRDEAFRCKEIIDKLLSLARNSSDSREALDLSGVAREVASMTHGLKNYRDRRLTLKLDPTEPLEVQANLTEMKQVLLNLTINALEAVPPVDGEVCIEGRRTRDWVELSVKDNGRGMCPDVLQHVFEPFFTARRGNGPGDRGTGLGLSITHAIVESHGGRIQAESDGVGRGARFTVRLPAQNATRRLAAASA